ncbi:MAG: ornithine cyclodeaminase family protein [Ktedonobacteraceae bacterium]
MALILSRDDVQRCLTMPEAIEAMGVAFSALSNGLVHIPQRSSTSLQDQGVVLLMSSLLQTTQPPAFGIKVITVMPGNLLRNLPRSYASLLLLDAQTGKTLAIMEGGWLTALRTGAASGFATSLLARKDAHVLALFGAGVQAPMQVLAIHTVRPLSEVRVVNQNDDHYQHLVETLQTSLGTACPPIYRAATSREALAGASLVACASASTAPLFSWREVAPGTHINAIGAFTPEMCEVDAETLAHARIVVDQREAALIEAGDLLQALASNHITGPDTWTEIGELAVGKYPGRQSQDEITFFKSVGVAVQDVAAAWQVYTNARAKGIGIEIEV